LNGSEPLSVMSIITTILVKGSEPLFPGTKKYGLNFTAKLVNGQFSAMEVKEMNTLDNFPLNERRLQNHLSRQYYDKVSYVIVITSKKTEMKFISWRI